MIGYLKIVFIYFVISSFAYPTVQESSSDSDCVISGLTILTKKVINSRHTCIKCFYSNCKSQINKSDTIDRNDSIIIDVNHPSSFKKSKIISQYRLLGLSNKWIGNDIDHIEFTSLDPGNYCFEYRVKSLRNPWSIPATFSFVVDKPFWMRSTFIVSMLSILFFVLNFIFLKYLKAKNLRGLVYLNNKLELSEMKGRLLHSMMNPHFIFNTLNSIQYHISCKNPNEAQKNLKLFSNLIRKNLEISQNKFISIDEEISFLEMYMSLENKRSGNVFTFQIDHSVDIDTSCYMIPSLMIQPLVENSIKHGLYEKTTPGNISVEFVKHNNHIEVIVMDDGLGFESDEIDEKENLGMSLTIIKERLLLMKSQHNFEFEINFSKLYENKEDMSGAKVTIKLPLILKHIPLNDT